MSPLCARAGHKQVLWSEVRTGRLVQLAPAHAEAAYAYCEKQPHACAFIAGWIREGGLAQAPRVPRGWLLAEMDRGGPVQGLVYISDTGIILPALSSPEAEQDLVRIGQRNPAAARVLVGERTQLARIWRGLELTGARARQVRDQRGYLVSRGDFRPAGTLDLVPATESCLDALVEASAAMAREEARDDPQRRNPAVFRDRIRERMMRGRDLVYLEAGRLLFKSNVSTISPMAGQVEGIYTLPSARRTGLGTRGTSTVTQWVLEQAEQAFLLVNEDNQPAQRLYERLGYRYVIQSRTIFVAP